MHDGWHLNKNLTMSHLGGTLVVAFWVVVFGVQLAADVDVSASSISTNTEDIKRIETVQSDSKANTAAIQQILKQQGARYAEIIKQLDRINDKLDTKADK